MFGFSNPHVSRLIQALPNARVCCKFQGWAEEMPSADMEVLMPAGFRAVEVEWKHLDCCSMCYTNEEYEGNVLLQCDKCRMLVHMNCYGEDGAADGSSWLCNLCRPEAPKQNPPCCLCPVKGGAMKNTADGRWVHLACVLWIPEIWCADMKRMEPIDGLNSINKNAGNCYAAFVEYLMVPASSVLNIIVEFLTIRCVLEQLVFAPRS